MLEPTNNNERCLSVQISNNRSRALVWGKCTKKLDLIVWTPEGPCENFNSIQSPPKRCISNARRIQLSRPTLNFKKPITLSYTLSVDMINLKMVWSALSWFDHLHQSVPPPKWPKIREHFSAMFWTCSEANTDLPNISFEHTLIFHTVQNEQGLVEFINEQKIANNLPMQPIHVSEECSDNTLGTHSL